MNTAHSNQRGATALYIALMIAFLIVSGALVLSSTLSIQLRLIQDIVSSERAFYAANSGVEEALYALVEQNLRNETGEVEIGDGEVPYDDEPARYTVVARLVAQGSRVQACISSLGEYRSDQRRIGLGPTGICE